MWIKYERIMRTELDIIAEKNYARETGKAEGHAEGHAEGLAEGKAKGLAEGKAEMLKKAKTAVAMFKKGSSVEEISKETGLKKEDIMDLL